MEGDKIPALWLQCTDAKKLIDDLVYFGFCWIKFSLIFFNKKGVACINQKETKKIKNPVKLVDELDSQCNEYDKENNGE